MTELSPKARALIEHGKRTLRPTEVDRERIEAALRARLGSDVLPELATTGHAASTVSWPVLAGAAVGVVLLGVVAWRVLTPEPSSPAVRTTSFAAPAPAPAPVVVAEKTAQEALPTELPRSVAPPAKSKSSRKPTAPTVNDRLALEVELLSRATRALRAGEAAKALTVLDEHQSKFPKGALQQERSLARARALCILGRVSEGRAELTHLPKDAPATVRASKACGPSD